MVTVWSMAKSPVVMKPCPPAAAMALAAALFPPSAAAAVNLAAVKVGAVLRLVAVVGTVIASP